MSIEKAKDILGEMSVWLGPSIESIETDNKTQLIRRLRKIANLRTEALAELEAAESKPEPRTAFEITANVQESCAETVRKVRAGEFGDNEVLSEQDGGEVGHILGEVDSVHESKPEPEEIPDEIEERRKLLYGYNARPHCSHCWKVAQIGLSVFKHFESKSEPTEFIKRLRDKADGYRMLYPKPNFLAESMQACDRLESQAEQIKELSAQARNASLFADERNELREQLAVANKEIEHLKETIAKGFNDAAQNLLDQVRKEE